MVILNLKKDEYGRQESVKRRFVALENFQNEFSILSVFYVTVKCKELVRALVLIAQVNEL